jgi:hypothetical protein
VDPVSVLRNSLPAFTSHRRHPATESLQFHCHEIGGHKRFIHMGRAWFPRLGDDTVTLDAGGTEMTLARWAYVSRLASEFRECSPPSRLRCRRYECLCLW